MLALLVTQAHAVPTSDSFRAEVLCDDGNAVDRDGCTDGYLSDALVDDWMYDEDPDVAILSDGSAVVVWQEYVTGGRLFARHYDSSGQPMGADFVVSDGWPTDARSPRVAALTGGGYVVAFEQGGAYTQRYDAADNLVSISWVSSWYGPRVAGTPSGGYAVLWREPVTPSYEWYVQMYTASDAPVFSSPILVSAEAASADLGVFADGSWVVAASDYDGTDHVVAIQRYDAAGAPLGAPLPGFLGRHVSLDVWPDGSFAVACTSSSTNGIRSRVYDASDVLLGSSYNPGGGYGQLPALGTTPGGYLMTWEDTLWGTVYGQSFDRSGAPVGPEFVAGGGWDPRVAGTADGRFLLAWDDYPDGLVGRWMDAGGTPLDWNDPTAVDELPFAQDALVTGGPVRFRVEGALPGETVWFLRGAAGSACPPRLGGRCVEIANPRPIGSAVAGADGSAELIIQLPAAAPAGQDIVTQAVIARGVGGADSVVSRALADTTS